MKENRKIKTYGSLITILLILIVAVIGWSFNEKGGLQLDPDQEEGTLDGMSEKEIRELMEKKAAEGEFIISINQEPKFPNGSSEGSLRIENSPQNRYLMVVAIYERKSDGTPGKKLYESGAIRPGSKIEKDTLDVKLKKGSYPVQTVFSAYDVETKDYVGKAIGELTIVVEE